MEAALGNKPKRKIGGTEIHPLINYLMLTFGILGILVVLLVVLGWLPLGERANILRSDKNAIEYAAMILSALFGIASLRTFWGPPIQRTGSAIVGAMGLIYYNFHWLVLHFQCGHTRPC